MQNKFKIRICVFSLFGFFFLLCITGCGKQNLPGNNSKIGIKSSMEADISQEANNFTLSSVGDDGASNWQLEGKSALISEDKIDLKNIKIKSQSNNTCLTMKANKGTIMKNDNTGIFNDDVVLTYDDGTTINTDKVNWFFKKQVAQTSSPVLLKSGNLSTKALGAYLKKDASQIQLQRDILMNTSSGTTIKCDGPLIMDYKKNIAVFNKNVSIENIKGKMLSRKMVVFFDPAKKAIKKVEAFGDVCLTRGNSISTSDRAVYFSEDGRAVLTGHPKVFLDYQEVRSASNQQILAK